MINRIVNLCLRPAPLPHLIRPSRRRFVGPQLPFATTSAGASSTAAATTGTGPASDLAYCCSGGSTSCGTEQTTGQRSSCRSAGCLRQATGWES